MRRRPSHPLERALPRRTLLRGALAGGVAALALPCLEAMLDEHGEAHADGTPLPRRFVTWVFGNGCRLDHWVPTSEGPDYALTEELAPLAAVQDRFAVLSNFKNPVAGRRGHHDGMAGCFSGYPFIGIDPMGAPYASKFGGPSIDQVIADLIGQDSYFRSLQVGVSKRHNVKQGPTLATMSHRGPDQPLYAERDPQALFDRLFDSFSTPDNPESRVRFAALDAASRDAARLKRRLGAADRARLDAHVDGLFSLQKQILELPPSCSLPSAPDVPGYLEDGREPLLAINAAMVELVTMALSCDLTRVASFMFTGPSGGTHFDMLTPDSFPDFPDAKDLSRTDQHQVSHINLPYEQAFVHRSVVVCMQAFAKLCESFAASAEGGVSLLDQSCILMTSCTAEGWIHSEVDYPLIVAGRAGGGLKSHVGHHRSATEESTSDVLLALVRAVAPEADVAEIGGADDVYDGRSKTPCTAILA